MLTVGSLFSGAGGFEQGFERAGFRPLWQCEIDRDATSVLERHWPDVRRFTDVREINPRDLEPVDVVVFGSPCQDMSVAGKRAGLDGERSGLFHEAVRIIAGLRPVPSLVVWENVPGALSSSDGRDFAAVLDALADVGALDICWRVLDSQWWGVPQRRRRIFLVADFGGQRAASVLFESESVRGDSEEGSETRQDAARDAEDGTGDGGVAACLRTGGYGHGTGLERGDGNDNLILTTAYTLAASARGTGDGHGNAWNSTYVPVSGEAVAHCLTARNQRIDAESETFVVAPFDERQITSKANRSTVERGADSPTLNGGAGMSVAFHLLQDPINGDLSPALGAGSTHGQASIGVVIPSTPEQVMWYNSGVGDETYAATEARSREILCRMREALGEETFQRWALGIVEHLHQAEVLRSGLHGQELRCAPEQIGGLGDDSLPRSEDDSEGSVLGMLRAEWSGCPPHRRGSYEQLAGELDTALSELSSQAAQDHVALLGLRGASEGLGLLREALSALQEARRSEQTRRANQEDVHGVPGAGQRSEPVRSPLHASEAGGNAHGLNGEVSTKGVGGSSVRRLTPRLCECERLMNWPDDWTRYRADGSELPDGARYRLCGNGVVASVAEWLARRVHGVLEA